MMGKRLDRIIAIQGYMEKSDDHSLCSDIQGTTLHSGSKTCARLPSLYGETYSWISNRVVGSSATWLGLTSGLL